MNEIKVIFYDFDGVMTNNKVYVDKNGNEMVQVNRADGLGISEIKKLGIKQIIISTEKHPVVSARAKKLGIPCFQGIDDKKLVLDNYCKKNKFQRRNTAYLGNDINDKSAMEIVGMRFCPSDAHESIQLLSDYKFISKGGDGVIRELFDYLTEQREK